MPKYKVLTNLDHGGKNYAPGKTVELPEELAARIPWAVELITKPEPDVGAKHSKTNASPLPTDR